MRKCAAVLLLLVLLPCVAAAEWEPYGIRQYGGNGADYVRGALAMPDGGFLLLCSTDSTTGDLSMRPREGKYYTDALLLRLDPEGEILWSVLKGGQEKTGTFYAARIMEDGQIVLHYEETSYGKVTHSLVHLSAAGEVLREAMLPEGTQNAWPLSDGCLITGWEKEYESFQVPRVPWVERLNDAGESLCRISLPTLKSINIRAATEWEDGLLLYGSALGDGRDFRKAFILSLSHEGKVQWQYEEQRDDLSYFTSVTPLADGGLIGVGSSTLYNQGIMAVITRLNPSGELMWRWDVGAYGDTTELINAFPYEDGYLAVGITRGSESHATSIFTAVIGDYGVTRENEVGTFGSRVRISEGFAVHGADGNLYLFGNARDLTEEDRGDSDIVATLIRTMPAQ